MDQHGGKSQKDWVVYSGCAKRARAQGTACLGSFKGLSEREDMSEGRGDEGDESAGKAVGVDHCTRVNGAERGYYEG